MLKYISLFSGIGAFEKALFNIGVPYELINYCEIDKYASKAYSLIHHIPAVSYTHLRAHETGRNLVCRLLLEKKKNKKKKIINNKKEKKKN